MEKNNIIIQCRFSSSRLPGKAMYPLRGIPILAFLIRRLKHGLSEEHFRLILATSSLPQDDPTAAWAKYEGIHCIRGDHNNVLARYIQTIKTFPSPVNVRVTADNPLTCPEIIKQCVDLAVKEGFEYTSTEGFPYGAGVDIFTDDLLYRISDMGSTPEDLEHINNVVLNNSDQFNRGRLDAPPSLAKKNLRMTVDTPEDFKLMDQILSSCRIKPIWTVSLSDAIQLFETFTKKIIN